MPVSCGVIKYKAQELDQIIQKNTASYQGQHGLVCTCDVEEQVLSSWNNFTVTDCQRTKEKLSAS
jgi:hypothetical protein